MLSKVLDDGTLIFADGFGLTRLRPGKAAKSFTKGFAHPCWPLVVAGEPPRVLLRSSFSAMHFVLDVATLKVMQKLEYNVGEAIHPDLERFVTLYGIRDDKGMEISRYPDIRDSGAPTIEPLVLGGEKVAPAVVSPDTCGDMGLWFDPEGRWIALVKIGPGDERQVIWRADVRVPELSILRPFLDESGLWLVAWTPSEGRVQAIRASLDGSDRRTVELSSLAMPAVDGESILFQPDEDTVVRRRGDDEEQRFDLAEVIRAARAKWGTKKSAPPHRPPQGPGKLAAGAGMAYFVPWHAETIINLSEATESPRKLPAKMANLREAVTMLMLKERDEIPRLIDLCYLSLKSNGQFNISFWEPALDGREGPSMGVVTAMVRKIEAETGHLVMAYGSQG